MAKQQGRRANERLFWADRSCVDLELRDNPRLIFPDCVPAVDEQLRSSNYLPLEVTCVSSASIGVQPRWTDFCSKQAKLLASHHASADTMGVSTNFVDEEG